jgi:hypothetical protein
MVYILMKKEAKMKTLKNQKVNATLQFLRRFTAVETWLKPVIKPVTKKSLEKSAC